MLRVPVLSVLLLTLLVSLAACRGSSKSSTVTAATPSATIAATAAVMIATPESTPVGTPTATPRAAATPGHTATPRATATPGHTATPRAGATPVASPLASPTVDPGVRGTPQPTNQVKALLAKSVTSDYQPVGPTTVFSTTSPKVFLAFTTTGLPANSTLSSVWVAEKVDADVPSNYVIDRADLKVSGSQSGDFSLASPTAGFPTGAYRVDLYLNGTLIGSYPFTVK